MTIPFHYTAPWRIIVVNYIVVLYIRGRWHLPSTSPLFFAEMRANNWTNATWNIRTRVNRELLRTAMFRLHSFYHKRGENGYSRTNQTPHGLVRDYSRSLFNSPGDSSSILTTNLFLLFQTSAGADKMTQQFLSKYPWKCLAKKLSIRIH
jgi:hypothetical protein